MLFKDFPDYQKFTQFQKEEGADWNPNVYTKLPGIEWCPDKLGGRAIFAPEDEVFPYVEPTLLQQRIAEAKAAPVDARIQIPYPPWDCITVKREEIKDVKFIFIPSPPNTTFDQLHWLMLHLTGIPKDDWQRSRISARASSVIYAATARQTQLPTFAEKPGSKPTSDERAPDDSAFDLQMAFLKERAQAASCLPYNWRRFMEGIFEEALKDEGFLLLVLDRGFNHFPDFIQHPKVIFAFLKD